MFYILSYDCPHSNSLFFSSFQRVLWSRLRVRDQQQATSLWHPPVLSILAAGARGGGWEAPPPTSRTEGSLASPAREERRVSLLFSLGAL